MIIAHYDHRLPAYLDLGLIRTRVREGGPRWDAVPELYFKAFLLREKGRYGAGASSYESLYLWRQDTAFRDFLVNGTFRTVTDTFGRPDIQTRVALDARQGQAHDARFVYQDVVDLPLDADIASVCVDEITRNREIAGAPGVVAAVVGLNPRNWTLSRIILSEREPIGTEAGMTHQILYLARPLLETLPHAAAP